MTMQPVSRSTARLLAAVTASSGGGKGVADNKTDHSHIHEPCAGVTGVVLQWEPVESVGDWRPDDYTVAHVAFYRAKVPGGWLVAMKGSYQANGMGLTFYPDPLNAW